VDMRRSSTRKNYAVWDITLYIPEELEVSIFRFEE
jgi:hypothetical protein